MLRFARSAPGLVALVLVAAGCPAPQAPPHPRVGAPTQPNTDGYNYGVDAARSSDFIYNQLWYFNFLDGEQGIAGVAAYGLANPENRLWQQGLTNSFGMILRDPASGDSFPVYSEHWDPAAVGNFAASRSFEPGPGFEFQNPGGTIDVISPDHYHVVGRSLQGEREIHWDLHYRRGLGDRWRPWVDWPVPPTAGVVPAWISYHMQMANAVVNGSFRVVDGDDDVNYTLKDAMGYHDGFYSKFVFSMFEWDWIDYKQENLSVHLLHPHAPAYSCRGGWETCTPGNLRVVYDDGSGAREYNFYRGRNEAEREIEIHYDAMTTAAEFPSVEYPTAATILAKDAEGNTLELHWERRQELVVYYDVPDPFDDTVTFEIIAEFSGTFRVARSGETVPIRGTGWSDWSGAAFPEGESPVAP